MDTGRVAAGLLLGLALLGGMLIPVLPCARASSDPRVLRAAGMAYGLGRLVCHQRSERSFHSCGAQWPVCGRCSGLYLGAALGAAIAGARRRRTAVAWGQWRRRMLVAAAPIALLWGIEAAGLFDPGTPVRFLTALPLGLTTSAWLAAIVREELSGKT